MLGMSYIIEEGSAAHSFWKLVENIINNRFVQLNICSLTAFLTTSNIERYIKSIFIYIHMYIHSHWHYYKLDHICFKNFYFLKTVNYAVFTVQIQGFKKIILVTIQMNDFSGPCCRLSVYLARCHNTKWCCGYPSTSSWWSCTNSIGTKTRPQAG